MGWKGKVTPASTMPSATPAAVPANDAWTLAGPVLVYSKSSDCAAVGLRQTVPYISGQTRAIVANEIVSPLSAGPDRSILASGDRW
jgi:hypothetical protein